jgi:hypothetical protein
MLQPPAARRAVGGSCEPAGAAGRSSRSSAGASGNGNIGSMGATTRHRDRQVRSHHTTVTPLSCTLLYNRAHPVMTYMSNAVMAPRCSCHRVPPQRVSLLQDVTQQQQHWSECLWGILWPLGCWWVGRRSGAVPYQHTWMEQQPRLQLAVLLTAMPLWLCWLLSVCGAWNDVSGCCPSLRGHSPQCARMLLE